MASAANLLKKGTAQHLKRCPNDSKYPRMRHDGYWFNSDWRVRSLCGTSQSQVFFRIGSACVSPSFFRVQEHVVYIDISSRKASSQGPPQSLTLELKGLISPPLWQHIRTENEQYQYPCCWALGEVWMVWCSQGYPLENSCWALHHSYHLEVLLKAVVPVRSVMVGCVDDSQSSHLGAF